MPRRDQPATDATPCRELWNLSDTTAKWLADEGVHTFGDLRRQNLPELWARLKAKHTQVTKLMFLALAGAVLGVHWRLVPAELVEQFEAFRQRASKR